MPESDELFRSRLRERLKPMLFDDEQIEQAHAARASPVAKAIRSEHARAKDASKCADVLVLRRHHVGPLLQDRDRTDVLGVLFHLVDPQNHMRTPTTICRSRTD